MKILVSACLLGTNCKYNGGNNDNQAVRKFVAGHEVVMVCPEVMGGLPIPRTPAEIVEGVVRCKDGHSVDQPFRDGAERALKTALDEKVDLAILQSRSPSCGVKAIYDGTFSHTVIPGEGVFARMLRENGIQAVDAEDI